MRYSSNDQTSHLGFRGRRRIAGSLALMVTLSGASFALSAEMLVNFYIGPIFSEDEEVGFEGIVDGEVPTRIEVSNLDTEDTITYGGRAGYWFDERLFPRLSPFGLAIDVSHFDTINHSDNPIATRVMPAPQQNLSVAGPTKFGFDATVIAFEVMARHAFGSLMPYAYAGPAMFLTEIDVNTPAGLQPDLKNSVVSGGVKAGAGLEWVFNQYVGLFAEYAYLHGTPEYRIPDNANGGYVYIDADIDSHAATGGVALHY